ncbi:BPTI/Kunitz domain-containing protein 4 isoform X1 [Hydra vulgaris]|uniref:BPTI/Kunitz domain-containing protein 4 isoform X1 n=1 Tax=Hydra vulgaris TaxID=6087 RepID=UPI001F5FA234|nr:BPTI/Kunitz domain-containing protein 4-like [Hydra vulgaris]
MKHFILALFLFFSICYTTTALKCINCALVRCKSPEGCKAGTVKDFCGCCDICAQASGEECGGVLLRTKKCGNELECVKKNSTDLMGICRPRCGPFCKMFCPYGYVLDKNGCPTCRCNSQPKCGPVCMIYCENGNVLDARGCPTCKCNQIPKCVSKPYSIEETIIRPMCPKIACPLIKCAYGQVLDEYGCKTCSCRSVPPLCSKDGCCKEPTRFCNKNNNCCIHDSTCFPYSGWYRS